MTAYASIFPNPFHKTKEIKSDKINEIKLVKQNEGVKIADDFGKSFELKGNFKQINHIYLKKGKNRELVWSKDE
jgi:predicted RNA-binding protein